MKKKAIIYSFNSVKTKKMAEMISAGFGNDAPEAINAESISGEEFTKYDFLILGVPTWFDGELPNYWDEFVPEMEELDLQNKKFALFGLGDQKGYPENFADGIGIMAKLISERGGVITGYTPAEGYHFESSKALTGNQFCGLVLDQENQPRLSAQRITNWVEILKKEGF